MVKKKLMIGVLVILLFFMTFVSASVCGNGVIEEGEACDDGNTADLDACSSTCICVDSDGGKDTLVKGVACYFGQCTYDICGGTTIIYGVSYVVNEAYCVGDRAFKNPINCDPGYHCSNGACVLSCGDGTVSETEECDGNSESCTDSNGYNGTKSCLSDCTWDLSCITTESCGDGIVNGNEECDDSNIINGDGCSSICKNQYYNNTE